MTIDNINEIWFDFYIEIFAQLISLPNSREQWLSEMMTIAIIASLDDDDAEAGNDSNDSGIEAVGVSHAGPPRFRPQHNGRLGRRLCYTFFSCALWFVHCALCIFHVQRALLFRLHYHHNYKYTIYIHASLVKFLSFRRSRRVWLL